MENETKSSFGTPYASVVRSLNFGFYPETQLINEDSLTNYAIVLRGFNLSMRCSDSKPNTTCNSNGIWPSYISMSTTCNILNPYPASAQIGCMINFFLNRTDIPFHYKFSKPLNTVMQYQLTIGTTLIVANKVSSPSFPVYQSIQVDHLLPSTFKVASSIEYPAMPVNRVFEINNLRNTSVYGQAIVGITGFSFDLLETLGVKSRGRYLEGKFSVA